MKTHALTVLFLAFCFSQKLLSCPVWYEYTHIYLSDFKSKAQLGNADIVVMQDNKMVYQLKSDSSGYAYINLSPGEYTFRIIHPSYLPFVYHTKINSYDYETQIRVRLSSTRKSKATEDLIKSKRSRYRYEVADETPMLADALHDRDFHSVSCRMQHYSRSAWQDMMKSPHISNVLSLYPNPVSGTTLYIESRFDEQKLIVVYDVAGKEQLRSTIVLHQQIDVSSLVPGIYFLKVIDERNDDVTVNKFVVR